MEKTLCPGHSFGIRAFQDQGAEPQPRTLDSAASTHCTLRRRAGAHRWRGSRRWAQGAPAGLLEAVTAGSLRESTGPSEAVLKFTGKNKQAKKHRKKYF